MGTQTCSTEASYSGSGSKQLAPDRLVTSEIPGCVDALEYGPLKVVPDGSSTRIRVFQSLCTKYDHQLYSLGFFPEHGRPRGIIDFKTCVCIADIHYLMPLRKQRSCQDARACGCKFACHFYPP